MNAYFKNIKEAFGTLSSGLRLTMRYLEEARQSRAPIGVADEHYFDQETGRVTLEYPYESLPVPDNARYRLHNEIDDCIVCDKCAKVCPVDCIEIDPIRSPETFGTTSDGTPKKIHAAKFDIDMSKCCFCGLCTTVCPTECLTMTKVYDFSEFEVEDHVYSFADMTLAEIAQKRQELAEFEAKKAEEKAAKSVAEPTEAKKAVKPAMKPVAKSKPAMKPRPVPRKAEGDAEEGPAKKAKPVMRPKPMKPKISQAKGVESNPKPKPVMKPKAKSDSDTEEKKAAAKPKQVIKPKPIIKTNQSAQNEGGDKPKPKFKPRPMIPKKKNDDGDK